MFFFTLFRILSINIQCQSFDYSLPNEGDYYYYDYDDVPVEIDYDDTEQIVPVEFDYDDTEQTIPVEIDQCTGEDCIKAIPWNQFHLQYLNGEIKM